MAKFSNSVYFTNHIRLSLLHKQSIYFFFFFFVFFYYFILIITHIDFAFHPWLEITIKKIASWNKKWSLLSILHLLLLNFQGQLCIVCEFAQNHRNNRFSKLKSKIPKILLAITELMTVNILTTTRNLTFIFFSFSKMAQSKQHVYLLTNTYHFNTCKWKSKQYWLNHRLK